MSDIEEMADLLTYANLRKVGDALGVSKNAVSQWARGKDVTPYRVRQVRDLLRPPAPQDAAPPGWVERLLAGTMALETKARVSATERDQAEADALAWLATSTPRTPTQPKGGGAGGASNA